MGKRQECSFKTSQSAPRPCEGPLWVCRDYFQKGRDRRLYACEKHAKWRMSLGVFGPRFVQVIN